MELSKEFEKATGEESHMIIREMYSPKAKYVQWLEYQVLKSRAESNKPLNKVVEDGQAKYCNTAGCHHADRPCKRWQACYDYTPAT